MPLSEKIRVKAERLGAGSASVRYHTLREQIRSVAFRGGTAWEVSAFRHASGSREPSRGGQMAVYSRQAELDGGRPCFPSRSAQFGSLFALKVHYADELAVAPGVVSGLPCCAGC